MYKTYEAPECAVPPASCYFLSLKTEYSLQCPATYTLISFVTFHIKIKIITFYY
jgi:hypothetical protein